MTSFGQQTDKRVLTRQMLSFIVLVVNLAFSYGANPCAFQALSMHFGNGCNERANYRPGGEIVEGAINMANSLLNVSRPLAKNNLDLRAGLKFFFRKLTRTT